MAKSEELFQLLSKLMSEDKVNNITLTEDVEEAYNCLYSLIDVNLMHNIEKIGYIGKYNVVESLKKVIIDYKLLLYFPEIICRNVVSVYKSANLSTNILQLYDPKYSDKSFALRKNKIIDNTPIIFTSREEGWGCLTVPENLVEVTNEDYDMTQKLLAKGFSANSLIAVLSGALAQLGENLALCILPTNRESNKYIESVMAYTDCVIADASFIKNLTDDLLNGLYPYLKKIIVVGHVNNKVKGDIAELFFGEAIYVENFKEACDIIDSMDTPQNNYLLTERLAEMINRVLSFSAERISQLITREENLKRDIMMNSEDTEDIEELKTKVSRQIDSEKGFFKAMMATQKEISAQTQILEETIRNYYAEITGADAAEFEPDESHYPIKKILQNLYLQYSSFLKIDDTKSSKDTARHYSNRLKSEYPQYSEAVAMCDGFYKNKISEKNVISFAEQSSEDAFITRLQIRLASGKLSFYSHKKVFETLAGNIPSIAEEYVSADEFYFAGLYFETILNDLNSALRHYEISLSLGNVYAGDRIIDINTKSGTPIKLEDYADLLVPEACYRIGEEQLKAINTREKGILNLKISASCGKVEALKCLADYKYNQFLYAVNKNKIDNDEFFENAKASITLFEALDSVTRKKKHFKEIGMLAYYTEDYSKAFELLEKTDDGECYNLLGIMFEKGKGYAIDKQTALNYYLKAQQKGSAEGAANYDRLNAIIAEENRKNIASAYADYSSGSYYYYSSYYSGYYSGSGCVAAGTEILLADGTLMPVENIKSRTRVLNCNNTISSTSDELVINDSVEVLYAVNDDVPFMSPEHAILTERGWCSLAPEESNKINPFFDVKELKTGDVFYKKVLINGKAVLERCVVEKINISPNTSKKICYDLHFYDGYNSYYANGYPCLLNYPVFTLASLSRNLEALTEEQLEKFAKMSVEYRDILEKVFGKTNLTFLFKNELDIG